ncbi:MAG TPA: tetratricopeptide repeat protein [Tepidisphaeraceae bacterium]|nr:tetratricopeptide repeat protein [Tepidisphaeraceae bacterium]
MIVRAKTKVRLLILLAGVALLIGAAATIYVVRKHRIHNSYMARRASGMAQYQKGDYASTLVVLGPYIRREEYSTDAEAIYAFAESRRRVEMPDGKHLYHAMTSLQRVLSLQSGRTDVQRELLDLYAQLGYNVEAVDLADKLLLSDKNDLQALRAKARGLAGRQLSEQALEVCEHFNTLVPLDLEIRALSLEILRDLGRRPQILQQAQEILSKNPNDPKAELITAIAFTFIEEIPAAQRDQITALIKERYPADALPKPFDPFHCSRFFAIKASQRDLNDLVFVRYLVEQLDRTRLIIESLAVLQKMDVQQDTPWVRQFLIRRLWESGRFADVLKRMEKLDIKGATATDIELLAFRGISQARSGLTGPANETVKVLANLKDDRIAQAWATILQQLILNPNGDPRQVIDSTRSALALQRGNIYLRFFLGQAYLQLGERDAAVEAFTEVAAYRPLWQLPLLHLSRLMLDAGQKQSALETAILAHGINPTLAAGSNLAIIWAANTDLSTLDKESELVKLVAGIQQQVPGEESTLPLHAQLLAKTNQPDQAKLVIANALAAKPPPAVSTLLHLAAVSRASKLGLDEACLTAAEKSQGLTSDIALARAISMAESGKAPDVVKYFQDAMQKSGETDPSWRLGWATLLEQTKDDRASAVWVALADDPTLKSNLAVQREALAAPSTQKDPAFLSRVIDRIHAATGEQSIGWQMARARLLLRESATAKSPQLVKNITDIVAAAPNNVDARVLLASAYEKSGNISGAIEQITAARKLQPSSTVLNLELARLYTAQLDFQRAREILERIPPTSLDPAQRRGVARLIGHQGNIDRAIALMEGAVADAPAMDRLYLADLYRRSNQHTKAEAIYKSLLEKPDRIEIVMAAADYYASRGQRDQSMAILALLEKLQLRPAEKDYALAEFSSRHGNSDEALSRYLAVVKSDPTRPNGWRALVTEYIRAGKPAEAVEAANSAIRALSPDSAKPFENIIKSASTLKALATEKTLVPLMSSLLDSSSDGDAAAQALPIIADAIKNTATAEAVTTQLRPIADRAPRLVSLQMLLVQNYLVMGKPEEAAVIALRSQSASPASPEVARNAAVAVASTRRWAQALAPAQQWRELTPQNPLPADIFIADLHLRLQDHVSVLRQLQPYIEQAKAKPREFAPVIEYRARALMMRGDDAAVADLLGPLLSDEPVMRVLWRELSQFLPNPLAEKWFQRLAAATPPADVNENIELAIAWNSLFTGRPRFVGSRDPKHKDAASAVLDRLATIAPDHPFVVQARAILAQAEGRTGAAEQGYRRALELKPDLPICLNNLAMMVCDRGDHKEALTLAQRAVAALPSDASIRDTLAYVQLKLKDFKNAQESLKVASKLDPQNINWRIKLAQAYDEAGQMDDLVPLLDEIEKMMADTQVTDAQRQLIRQLRTKVAKTALAR